MKLKITNMLAIAFLYIAIAFIPLNSALADTMKSNSVETTQQAAKEVVKDTGVKQQFGKTENGSQLIDQAQQKANEKLNDLANEADSDQQLPESKKLFLDNLTNKNK
jgi:predicted secreted protein